MSKKDRSKKKKAEKAQRSIEYRSKEERQDEAKNVLAKLCELRLNSDYDEVKELISILQTYIQTGERIEINIPFPAIGRTIKGVLAINKQEQVVVMMSKN
jgi:hypothetical protein